MDDYRERLRATLPPHEQADGDGADSAWLRYHCDEIEDPREPDNPEYMRHFREGYEVMTAFLRRANGG